jgi:ATP-dependent DNA helicase RecG
MLNLDRPVGSLRGVGAEMERKLARLNIKTAGDLLTHYPRRYDDFSLVVPISAMRPGLVTVRGKILAAGTRRAHTRRLSITEAVISDSSGSVKAIWFNQPFILKTLIVGAEVLLSGRLEFRNQDLALQAPAIEPASRGGVNTGRILPVYAETEGLTSKQLRTLIRPLLALATDLPESLPVEIIKDAKLLTRAEALTAIHFPETTGQLESAKHRIAFEELFYLITSALLLKQDLALEKAPEVPLVVDVAQSFTAALGFQLTDAQRKAAWQILQDMERDRPMNRLLEGDVGSGKTVVALMAAVMAMAAGYQAALMVPTEILARQHSATIGAILAKLDKQIALVVGKQPAAEKREALAQIESGAAGLVIGTHALITAAVTFQNLGLVIIDEQHRFGVGQRQALKAKAGHLPHLLSMTATPIPRSLALTVYGDLDVSVIDSLPPGRQPIATRVVKNSERTDLYEAVDAELVEGRQCFVVCPLIDDSEASQAKSLKSELERLSKTVFSHRRLEGIHGKMKPEDKQTIMERFKAGDIDILVATSVIEVGIDVPNATIMIIEGADHFGLAALHQLRGRVGRGQHKSSCYLLYDSFSPGVRERLQALERTTDGFRLAQIDLELRGPGQIYGLQQHGILDLQMANITDTKLISEVRQYATRFVGKSADMLQYDQIRQQIARLQTVTSLD